MQIIVLQDNIVTLCLQHGHKLSTKAPSKTMPAQYFGCIIEANDNESFYTQFQKAIISSLSFDLTLITYHIFLKPLK